MRSTLKIGKRSISPKKARDKHGTQGIFLTEKEWKAVLSELKLKTTTIKKESPLQETLAALVEVELYATGKKKLRGAKEAVSEI